MKTIKKFDILLMVLIIVVVAIVGMKFVNLKSIGPGGEGVTYKSAQVEYVVSGVRIMTVDAIHVGDTLYSNETNNEIGKIVEVNVQPYIKNIETIDGRIVQAEMPEKYTVTVVVDTKISEVNTGYFAHGITEIKTNSESLIYTKYVKAISVVGGINFEK